MYYRNDRERNMTLAQKCAVPQKFISERETYHMFRRNIAATSLNIVCKNLYSVKSYDKKVARFCIKSMVFNFFDQFSSMLKTSIVKRKSAYIRV